MDQVLFYATSFAIALFACWYLAHPRSPRSSTPILRSDPKAVDVELEQLRARIVQQGKPTVQPRPRYAEPPRTQASSRTTVRTQPSYRPTEPVATGLPYKTQKYFLGSAERPSYEVLLQEAIPLGYAVLAKVRLADLVYLPDNTPNRQSYFNRVSAKHVDFVLCEPLTLAPRLVVELDGPSHLRQGRKKRDAFVDEVLRTVGLPIVHIPVQRHYDGGKLGALLRMALGREA